MFSGLSDLWFVRPPVRPTVSMDIIGLRMFGLRPFSRISVFVWQHFQMIFVLKKNAPREPIGLICQRQICLGCQAYYFRTKHVPQSAHTGPTGRPCNLGAPIGPWGHGLWARGDHFRWSWNIVEIPCVLKRKLPLLPLNQACNELPNEAIFRLEPK